MDFIIRLLCFSFFLFASSAFAAPQAVTMKHGQLSDLKTVPIEISNKIEHIRKLAQDRRQSIAPYYYDIEIQINLHEFPEKYPQNMLIPRGKTVCKASYKNVNVTDVGDVNPDSIKTLTCELVYPDETITIVALIGAIEIGDTVEPQLLKPESSQIIGFSFSFGFGQQHRKIKDYMWQTMSFTHVSGTLYNVSDSGFTPYCVNGMCEGRNQIRLSTNYKLTPSN